MNITEGNLIDQADQNLEAVDAVESTQAFEKVLKDAVPQMIDILKQATIAINSSVRPINNTLGGFNSDIVSINSAVGSFEKMLQDVVKVFSKKNEQSPKQHVTVSKPYIALEESSNSIEVTSAVQPITDERTKQEGKGMGGNFLQSYMHFSQGQMNFF